MLGLTNFVRPNILKTKILHLSMDRIWNYSWQNLTCMYKILNPALIYCREQQQKYVFHQVEFVDKNNLEAQNPRRDTSIPSVSAGLPPPCQDDYSAPPPSASNPGLRRLSPPSSVQVGSCHPHGQTEIFFSDHHLHCKLNCQLDTLYLLLKY